MGENENLFASADVLHKASHSAICQRCQRNGQKLKTHVQGVQSYRFFPLNMQICDVLAAEGVVRC